MMDLFKRLEEKIRELVKQVKLRKILICVTWSIFIISSAFCALKFYGYYSNRKVYRNVDNLYTASSTVSSSHKASAQKVEASITVNTKSLENKASKVLDKFQSLLQINADTVGWISVENTHINYPVVKYADNDYYLHTNFLKESSSAGCIFMDYRNKILPLDKNIILYGHNMKDMSMFRDAVLYKDKDFFYANDKISLDTLYQESVWQVFSVYVTDTSFNYLITDFANDEEYESYIKTIRSKSMFSKDINVNPDDHILTLSTCSYEFPDARTVVHAKLIKYL